jgi:hypothetical protein
MCYNAAHPTIWAKLFNIYSEDDISKKIIKNYNNYYNGIPGSTGWFIDQEIMYNNLINYEHLKVLMSDENLGYILVRVLDYKGSESIGSTSWCIVSSKDQFKSYVGDNNYQYFFFNFGEGIPAKLKMLAFTMDQNGEISYSHDRYNAEFENPVKYLKSIGVNDKIIKINSRERAIRTLDRFSKINDRYHGSILFSDSGNNNINIE